MRNKIALYCFLVSFSIFQGIGPFPTPPPPSIIYLEQRVSVHFSDIQSKLLYDPPTYTPSWLSSWTEKTEIEVLQILGGGRGGPDHLQAKKK